MLIEVDYLVLSLLLIAYSGWLYLRRRKKGLLYSTISLTFLTLSIVFQLLSSTWLVYVAQLGINYHFLELAALVFFACFVIITIVALRETSKTSDTKQPASRALIA